MTHFSYSTQGFTVIGCVIEGALGEKYVDVVRKNVLGTSGMTRTQVDDRFAIIPQRTRFYHPDKSGLVVNAELLDSSYKISGGWLSCADDMARFEVAILHDVLLRCRLGISCGPGRDWQMVPHPNMRWDGGPAKV
jgi:serine beta-lactamase-like protein LACTB